MRFIGSAQDRVDRCVRESWDVTLVRASDRGVTDTVSPPTEWQRLPPRAAGSSCDTGLRDYYRVADIAPDCRRAPDLLAAVSRDARNRPPRFRSSVDDRMGRELAARHPSDPQRFPTVEPIITDARQALAELPLDRITYIGHQLVGGDLLPAEQLRAVDGGTLSHCQLSLGFVWAVDLAIDGGRVAAIAMRRAIPAPF